MLASIGETTSQVVSIVSTSEHDVYQRDTIDYEQGAVEQEEEEETVCESDEEIEASGLSKVNTNSLIERLELLIVEPKAGHDELYDEMLKMSK